jgi:ParB family chromosome partitioning protein
MLTLAMVENLQRADLDPVEEADGYQRLVDEFDLTQQEVADVVGKDRSTIANALRLLALPASVKRLLQERQITVGHARALLPLGSERAMADLSRDIVSKSLSVRDVETRVRGARPSPAKTGRKITLPAPNDTRSTTAEARRVEELLRKKLQTTVSLHLTGKEQGEVRIAFFSNDDLERVLGALGIDLDS